MESNRSLTSLYGGVSQQAPAERPSNTFEELVNVDFNYVDGITRRAGTTRMDDVFFRGSGVNIWRSEEAILHAIDRDEKEKYLLTLGPVGPPIGANPDFTGFTNLTVTDWETFESYPIYTENSDYTAAADNTDPIRKYLNPRREQILGLGIAENDIWSTFSGTASDADFNVKSPYYFGYAIEHTLTLSGSGRKWEFGSNSGLDNVDGTKPILYGIHLKAKTRYPDSFELVIYDGTTVLSRAVVATDITKITSITVSNSNTNEDYMRAGLFDLEDGWQYLQISRYPLETGDVAVELNPTKIAIETETATSNGVFYSFGNMFLNEDNLSASLKYDYLLNDRFNETLRLMTVGDTTLIANTEKEPKMTADLSPAQDQLATIWVRGYNEERTGFRVTFKIKDIAADTVNEYSATVFSEKRGKETASDADPVGPLTPVTGAPADPGPQIAEPFAYIESKGNPLSTAAAFAKQITEDISAIESDWITNGGCPDLSNQLDVRLEENYVFLEPKENYELVEVTSSTLGRGKKVNVESVAIANAITGGDYTSKIEIPAIAAQENEDEIDLSVIFKTADRVTDLPIFYKDGAIVKVDGQQQLTVDDVWLKFEVNNSDNEYGDGLWIETIEPSTPYRIDKSTMPIALERRQDDATGTKTGVPGSIYFFLKEIDWAEKLVGTTENNQNPSFIGSKIHALETYENRILLVTPTGGVFSRSGDIYDFWRSTTYNFTADDRIDFTIESRRSVDIVWAKALNESVYFGGRNVQFSIFPADQDQPLTALNIQQEIVQEVDIFLVEPKLVSSTLFAAGPAGDYARVIQFSPRNDQERFPSNDVTLAVPRYLDTVLLDSAVSSALRKLVWAGNSGKLFVYSLNPNQRTLGGWYKWEIGDRVLGVEMIQNDVFFVVDRGGDKYLEKINLPINESQVFLDCKQTATSASYNGIDETTFTFPEDVLSDCDLVVDGQHIPVLSRSGATVTVHGDYSSFTTATCGKAYESKIVFSRPYNRFYGSDGLPKALIEENATVEVANLGILDTQAVTLQLTNGAKTYSKQYILPNISGIQLGSSVPTDGIIKYPIGAFSRDMELTMKTSLPFFFRLESAEWQLTQNIRKGRTIL